MNWQIEWYLLWKIGCINPIFFIAKNFSALKCKSIVFLCIQYTRPNLKINELEIYGSPDVRFKRVLEQIGYIPL